VLRGDLSAVAGLRLRAVADRVSESLFVLPAVLIVAGAGLSFAFAAADSSVRTQSLPDFLRIPPSAAETLLATIAGATITTAGVVFSITVVSVQLASGQFSPRVVRRFFRDKRGQLVVGTLLATFAYCVVALYTVTPTPGGANRDGPVVTVGAALVLALASILTIVGYLDHSARSLYVGTIARQVTDETIGLIGRLHEQYVHDADVPGDERCPEGRGFVVAAHGDGWVQQISGEALLASVPPEGTVRLETRPGAYVAAGVPVATLWPQPEDAAKTAEIVRSAFVVGPERTMQQDIDYGLRQLTDIALRALSPAVNDPTTAVEVVLRLGSILGRLITTELPERAVRDEGGRTLVRAEELDHRDLVEHAFTQIRLVAVDHPVVAAAIVRTLVMVEHRAASVGCPERGSEAAYQRQLLLAGCERASWLPDDLERLRAVAAKADDQMSAARQWPADEGQPAREARRERGVRHRSSASR
jgi:uncharacterized membrane protein